MRPGPEPEHLDRWEYQRFLKEVLPSLREVEPWGALEMIADLLDQALRSRSGNQQPNDYSYVWRPAIEDHEQNYDFSDVEGQLIVALRDVADHICVNDPESTSRIIEFLEGRNWDVFTRVSLYLLTRHPNGHDDLIRVRLTNEELFDSVSVMHEYRTLLTEGFGLLAEDEQSLILSWIRSGPRTEGGDRNLEERWAKGWQLGMLTKLRDWLEGDSLQLLEDLEQEQGPAIAPDLPATTSWVGPTSPVTAEELAERGPQATIKLLKTWIPPEGHFEPTPLGLARQLSAAIESDAREWAAVANQFIGVEATYVSHLLRGITAAVKDDVDIPWDPVLALADWVVTQDREIEGRDDKSALRLDVDPSRGPARQAVAELLSAGFEKGPSEMAIDHREQAWRLLETLSWDPEPTPDYEATYGGSNMDPATLSINTVRGEAMHAVVNYALWVHRYLSNSDPDLANFDGMPEVKEVLERHLDPSEDPSVAVRSVYGRAFPWLFLVDEEWSRAKVDDIFPSDVDESHLWEAAWETYVIFTRPFDSVLDVLEPKYREATTRLSQDKGERAGHLPEPQNRLIEHLLIYYLRGLTDLTYGGLLSEAYSHGSDALRSHGMFFVGRILADWDAERPIPSDWIDRFKAFARWRFETLTAADENASKEELVQFGWWFITGRLPEQFMFNHLVRAVEIAGWIEPDHEVVKQLVTHASKTPELTLRCLTLLLKNAREPWSVRSWASEAREILTQAMTTNARPVAIELANRFIARGFTEFEAVLPETNR
jgi:hypothetical protein